MSFLRYMAVMAIDSIPKKEGLHPIRVLEKDIQYVTEEHYGQNRAKLVPVKLAVATIKGEYKYVKFYQQGKLHTLMVPSANVPMSLTEMTERVVLGANVNNEDIQVLIRNDISITYPKEEVEIRLTLTDLDTRTQGIHKVFKPNTVLKRLNDLELEDVKVEDVKSNDIIAWMEMGPTGLTAVTRQVQHHSVRNLARPELTLIVVALDPSTEDLDNTIHHQKVVRLLQDGDGLDTISKIIADDMDTGYKHMEETRKQSKELDTATLGKARKVSLNPEVEQEALTISDEEQKGILEDTVELGTEYNSKPLTVDETDIELTAKPTTAASALLSPEDAEVAQTQRFAEVLDKYAKEETEYKYFGEQSDIE